MFDGLLCSYWPSYLNYQHAPWDNYNPPQLPALSHSQVHHNNCILWVDCECLSRGTCLSCPSTPQLSSQPWSLFECHHISISVSWVWGPWACPFYVASLFHNRKCFLYQVIKQVRGGKDAVHIQFMAKSFYHACQISHSIMGCCQVLCHPSSVFYSGKHSCHIYIQLNRNV